MLFSMLASKLKEKLGPDIEINSQEFFIDKFHEIYVPVFESRCHDKKEKVSIIRVNAVTGKMI